MARKTKIVQGTLRDYEKSFKITEMSALKTEKWAFGALSKASNVVSEGDKVTAVALPSIALDILKAPPVERLKVKKGLEKQTEAAQRQLEENAKEEHEASLYSAPLELVARLSMAIFMRLPEEIQDDIFFPLLSCVSFEDLNGNIYQVARKENETWKVTEEAEEYIEEPGTYALLRAQAFALHTDFFLPAIPSIFRLLAGEMMLESASHAMSREQ